MKRVLMVFLCLAVMFSAFAYEFRPDFTDEPFMFTETESMGGASIAISNGFEALFNNPAGFSSNGGEIVFTSLNIYGDMIPDVAAVENIISIFNSVENIADIDETELIGNLISLGSEDVDGIETTINVGAGLSAFGLGLGIISEVAIGFESDYASDYYAADVTLESELVAGLSHRFDLGFADLQVGANAKGLLFLDLDTYTYDDYTDRVDLYSLITVGYGFDAGAILALNNGLSVGVAVENIGGAQTYSDREVLMTISDAIEEDPAAYWNDLTLSGVSYEIPLSAKVGIGYESPRGHLLGFRLAADYDLDLNPEPEPRSRRVAEKTMIDQLQLGAELSVLGMAKVRAGLNQGYITAGASLNLFLVEVSATYYGDSIDQDTYRSIAPEQSREQFIIGVKVKL